MYKALDLAHDYQEKCKHLAKEKEQLQENMEKALAGKDEVIDGKSKEIEVLKENYEAVMRLNKQSTECVKNVDEALEKVSRNQRYQKLLLKKYMIKITLFHLLIQSGFECYMAYAADLCSKEKDFTSLSLPYSSF